jgi:uncharacterized protein (UPF0303 family)
VDVELLIEIIERQEREITLTGFDAHVAFDLGCKLVAEAQKASLPIAIDIGFFHQRLFFAAMPEATPDNAEWIRRKRNVVERFHRSSYAIGMAMKSKDTSLSQRYGLSQADFAEHGGAFPIRVNGCGVIGYAAASGLPQQEDHMLIVRALCGLIGKDPEGFELTDSPS